MRCIRCNKIVEDKSNYCPFCGYKIISNEEQSSKRHNKKTLLFVIGFLGMAFVIGLISLVLFLSKKSVANFGDSELRVSDHNNKESTSDELINLDSIIIADKKYFFDESKGWDYYDDKANKFIYYNKPVEPDLVYYEDNKETIVDPKNVDVHYWGEGDYVLYHTDKKSLICGLRFKINNWEMPWGSSEDFAQYSSDEIESKIKNYGFIETGINNGEESTYSLISYYDEGIMNYDEIYNDYESLIETGDFYSLGYAFNNSNKLDDALKFPKVFGGNTSAKGEKLENILADSFGENYKEKIVYMFSKSKAAERIIDGEINSYCEFFINLKGEMSIAFYFDDYDYRKKLFDTMKYGDEAN